MRDVVVIACSAEGMKALCGLVEKLPEPFPAPLVAVLHEASDTRGAALDCLRECTSTPFVCVGEGDVVEAGRIHLAPAERHLVFRAAGVLGLDPGTPGGTRRSAADRLFHSAANVYGPRVVGVVLAGSDGDGAEGLRLINAAGGIGIVEEPEACAGMGRSRGMRLCRAAEYCLPLDDIVDLMRRLIVGEGEGPLVPAHSPVEAQ